AAGEYGARGWRRLSWGRSRREHRPGFDQLSAHRTHSSFLVQHAGLDGAGLYLRRLACRRRPLRIGSGAPIHPAETVGYFEGPGGQRDPGRSCRIAQGLGGGRGVARLSAADRRWAVPPNITQPEGPEPWLRRRQRARLRRLSYHEPLRPPMDYRLLSAL